MSIAGIKDIITIAAIVLAGIWTFYRFGINRERHPKLQFDLDLEVLGKNEQYFFVNLMAIVENKGLTRQYIRDFKFSLLYLGKDSPIDTSDENINYQLKFESGFKSRNWLTQKSSPAFVDGQITHRFTYNTVVPANADYVLVYSKFRDPRKGFWKRSADLYHITKTFKVRELYNKTQRL